jgi:predicted nuclease of predicted toxin-antitoxin system
VLRLVLDQHAGGELYERLSASDRLDVESVRDVEGVGSRADDTDVWRHAVENSRVVLTNDRHFVDGSADPSDETHPGVIRYTEYDWPAVTKAIESIERATTTEEMAENRVEFRVPTGWID